GLRVLLSDESAKVCRLAPLIIRADSGPPSDTKLGGGFFVGIFVSGRRRNEGFQFTVGEGACRKNTGGPGPRNRYFRDGNRVAQAGQDGGAPVCGDAASQRSLRPAVR